MYSSIVSILSGLCRFIMAASYQMTQQELIMVLRQGSKLLDLVKKHHGTYARRRRMHARRRSLHGSCSYCTHVHRCFTDSMSPSFSCLALPLFGFPAALLAPRSATFDTHFPSHRMVIVDIFAFVCMRASRSSEGTSRRNRGALEASRKAYVRLTDMRRGRNADRDPRTQLCCHCAPLIGRHRRCRARWMSVDAARAHSRRPHERLKRLHDTEQCTPR
jgi:hypothetical protein